MMLSVFVLSRSRWLFMQYMKIENQFLHNFNGHDEETGEETKSEN